MTQNNEREEYLSKIAGYANTLGIGSVDAFRLLSFIELLSQNEQQPKQMPDGCRLVPTEPSSDQLNCAADVMKVQWQDSRSLQSKAFDIYKAMLNASPTTSLTSETNTEVGR